MGEEYRTSVLEVRIFQDVTKCVLMCLCVFVGEGGGGDGGRGLPSLVPQDAGLARSFIQVHSDRADDALKHV